MKQKSRSLRFNVAFYFFLLIGILLLVIWLFETFLITPYYEARSKSNLKNRASSYYNEYIMNNSKIDEISREAIMDNIHIYIATFETNERGETHLVPKNGEAIGRFSFDFNERELLEEYNSTNTMYSDSKFDLYMYIKDIDGTNDLFIASTRITPITATKMIITEQLDALLDKAKVDSELTKKLLETKNSDNPVAEFCKIATENGFAMSVMDMINQGEEFYAEIKRSTNGGGENSPDLDFQNDEYSIFISRLEGKL